MRAILRRRNKFEKEKQAKSGKRVLPSGKSDTIIL